MGIGSGPIADGIGIQTNGSPGPPTTTAVGSALVVQDGAGSPDISGLRLGYLGGRVNNTLVGLLFRLKPTSP